MGINNGLLCLLYIGVCCRSAFSQVKNAATASMDKVNLAFSLDKNGIFGYAVFYAGKPVIKSSRLGFKLKDNIALDSNFAIVKIDSSVYTTSKISEADAWKLPMLSFGNKSENIPDQSAVQTPLMLKTADGLYINIHEAALVNYPSCSCM